MERPNLKKIIEENLEKDKFQSKTQPSLPKGGWLDQYMNRGGTYISDRAKATQFGQYKKGGGMFPEYDSYAPPRHAMGGQTGDPNKPYHPITNPDGYKENPPDDKGGPTKEAAKLMKNRIALNQAKAQQQGPQLRVYDESKSRQGKKIYDEQMRLQAQANSDLSQTMGSFTPQQYADYTSVGGAGSIGANTQLAATALPVVSSAIGAAAPYIGPALQTAIAGVPGLTAGNIINAGFAYQGAKNLPNVYNAWGQVGNKPTWGNIGNAAGETAITGLDMFPFLHGASKGIPSFMQDLKQTEVLNKLFGKTDPYKAIAQNLQAENLYTGAPAQSFDLDELRRVYHNNERFLQREEAQYLHKYGHGLAEDYESATRRRRMSDLIPGARGYAPQTTNQMPRPLSELYLDVNAPSSGIGGLPIPADMPGPPADPSWGMNTFRTTFSGNTGIMSKPRPGMTLNPTAWDSYQANPSTIWSTPTKSVNRSGLTVEEALAKASEKDKEVISKMTDDEFKSTVLKPTGEIVPYQNALGIADKMAYNNATREIQATGSQPLTHQEYADLFNSRLDLLNQTIAKNNKSGVDFSVTGLTPSGRLKFNGPTGESTWGVGINPGQWKGEVEDIANTDYFKSIPGLDMQNTTNSVFGDYNPRRGTGAYESINDYLKQLDLGRVKAGFNSQTASSRPLWENAVKKGKAFGFYNNPNTVHGIMKSLLPIVGAGTVATSLSEEKYGGGLLSRTVTCSNCGHSWKGVTGGTDPLTCHNCGGAIKMANGGDISIADLRRPSWLSKYGPGGVTSPQVCYDPATGKEVPCKTGAHKTMIFTENGAIKKLTKDNVKELQEYINDSEFTKEAEDLKNYLIKNQPGEDIDIYPTYRSPEDDRVMSTFKDGQLTSINEILSKSTPNTRLAFMAHHGANLFGQPYQALGQKLQGTNYENCYLGSCYSGDIAASDEFKGLTNFHYRPGGPGLRTELNVNSISPGLSWLGVNPNKNSQKGEAGVNNAFYNTTYDLNTLIKNRELLDVIRDSESKLEEKYKDSKFNITDKRHPDYKEYNELEKQRLEIANKNVEAHRARIGNPKKGVEYDTNNPTNQPHIGTRDIADYTPPPENFTIQFGGRMGELPLSTVLAAPFKKGGVTTETSMTQRVEYQLGGTTGWLTKYAPGGVTTETTQPPFVFPSYTMPLNRTDAPGGMSIQEKQKQDDIAEEIQRRNVATNKRQFVGQGKASTKESEARRKMLTQQAVSKMPNVQYDEQTGTTSAINPNMTYEGQPANFMGERQQKSVDHIVGALEAAGYITGAGELAGAGYNAAKKALAESMESGLLSKASKLNPFAGTFEGESKLPGFLQLNKLDDPNAYWRLTKDAENYGVGEGAYFNKGVPLTGDVANTFPKGSRAWGHRYSGPKWNPKTGKIDLYDGSDYLFKVGDEKFMEPHLNFPEPHLQFFRQSENIPEGQSQLFKKDWLQGWKKEVPKPITKTLPPPQQAGFPNPLAIADAIVPQLPHPIRIPLLGAQIENTNAFTGSPLNFIPGYGQFLKPNPNAAFRKFGNSMQHVIDTKTLSPKGGASFRIGKDQILGEGNWASLNNVNENYKGTFAAKFDFRHPETNLGYVNPSDRNGVLITTKSGDRLVDIPIEDQGLSFHRRLPFSNKYVSIDKQKLLNNKFQWSTQGGYLQSLAEKYGYGLGYAGALGATGLVPNAVEKYNQYTIDPLKEQWKNFQNTDVYKKGKELDQSIGLDFLYDKKKQGGIIEDDRGQWDHPGEITEIGSNKITMKGVPYPVLGISDVGDQQMMYPEQEYKFKGKKVTEYPMAQNGRATRADSLAVLNNSLKVRDYYEKSRNYSKGPSSRTGNLHEGFTENGVTHYPDDAFMSLNNILRLIGTSGEFKTAYPTSSGKKIIGDLPTSLYYKNIDENKFYQREKEAGILDTRAPMQLFDRRIQPTSRAHYNNVNSKDIMYNDVVDVYGYDPISVTPWDMLNPAQQKERLKKYGPSGTPYDKKQTSKTSSKTTIKKEQSKSETKPQPSLKGDKSKAQTISTERKTPSGKIIERTSPNATLPPIQNLPYRVDYIGEDGKPTHTNFASNKEGEAFMKEIQNRPMGISGNAPGGSVEGYYENPPKKKKGGSINWLNKYQNGNQVFNIPGVTDFVMPKPVSESSSLGIQNNKIVNNQKLPVRETVNEIPEYIVKSGDTLSKIASAYSTTPMKLAQYNNISNPNVIGVNQKIKIPVAKQILQEYQDWETIKQRNQQTDFLSDEQKIVSYYGNRPDDTYLVVDKKNAKMNLYKGSKLVKSYEVGTGANPGDAQTVTRVVNGKTDWTGGNKSTGAGVYTISHVDPKSHEYFDLPAFNFKNDQGLEVATTIHGTPLARRGKFDNNNILDNRMSNGCINGKCFDLQDMYGKVDVGSKMYILPEDQGNQFQMVDGKPVLKVNAKNRVKYNEYVDQTGQKRKGQGVNQSINTLQYKPITSTLNEKAFKNDVYQANDFNDDNEYNNTTKPYVNALVNNKKKIMEATHISSDVYNEIAKMSFGIYGTESNFGDTHSALGNLGRAVAKFTNASASSSPDYKAKASTYGVNSDNNSVGLTQIRWSQLNNDERVALKKLGITSNKDFLNPKKAATATTAILAIRYSQQLTDDQKKDIWKHLPTKWNTRANYGSRVKNNSKYLSFKQLDEVKKYGGDISIPDLQTKQKGGMITDPRGQWAHPGQNTRIPGGNITMQGVPYPVLAKASNGMSTMMYPDQDYNFPGADYVDEYPMLEEGGWLQQYQIKGQVAADFKKQGVWGAGTQLIRNMFPDDPVLQYMTSEPTTAGAAVNLVDPTGISNAPFLWESIGKMYEDPSFKHGMGLVMDMAASVPIFGEPVKVASKSYKELIKGEKLGKQILKTAGRGAKNIIKTVEAPAILANKTLKKVGVTSPMFNNPFNLWNRGVHGYQTGLEGIRQGLNAISPGTQSFNDSGNATHPETLFHTPTFKKGGQNNNWLSKYK
jgi:LysM repeat protein